MYKLWSTLSFGLEHSYIINDISAIHQYLLFVYIDEIGNVLSLSAFTMRRR